MVERRFEPWSSIAERFWSPSGQKTSSDASMVVPQQPAEPFTALDRSSPGEVHVGARERDGVAEALVVSLPVVVGDAVLEASPDRSLAEEDELREACVADPPCAGGTRPGSLPAVTGPRTHGGTGYPLDHMAGPERTTPLGAPGGPERRGQAACSLIPCSGKPAYPIDSDPHAGETSYRPTL